MSYHEICENLCPDYLAMGMTLDEYWNGDPEYAVFVRKSFQLKQKQTNYQLWLQGAYIYEALLDVSPMFHDLIKDPKPIPYAKEPYALTETDKQERERNEAEEQDKKNQATIRAWVERVNRIKTKKGAKDG